MTRAGLNRNDGVVVTSALGTDHVLLQSAATASNSWNAPKLISVTNLLASPGDFTSLNLGKSGTAGQLNIFSSTASTGNLRIVDNSASGNFITTLTRASQGQATVVSIPDGGQATANVVLSEGAATINGAKSLTGTTTLTTLVATNTTFTNVPIGGQYVVQIYLPVLTALAGQVTALHSAMFTGRVTFLSASASASFTSTNIVITASIYHAGTPTAITTGVVTLLTAASAAGQTVSATPSAQNTFVAGDCITATITGGVGACTGVVAMLITRTA